MPVPPIGDLVAATQRSAVHLELRDMYTPDDPIFLDWLAGKPQDPAELLADWFDIVKGATSRGVTVRRVRIISEPITNFIRHEYEFAGPLNIAAGEDVRWLPRHKAAGLLVPACDLWIFDDQLIRWGHFSGDGNIVGHELTDDPAVVKATADAFEAVWGRAIPHREYRPS